MFEGFLAESDSVTVARLGGDPPLTLLLHGPVRDPSARLFPTDALQKGLVLQRGEKEVCGEGMGFALPVVACRGRALFPELLSLEVQGDGASPETVTLTARYDLCMIQVFLLRGRTALRNAGIYRLYQWLARAGGNKAFRAVRVQGARLMRAAGRARTDYERCASVGEVSVRMEICRSEALVEVDPSGLDMPGATLACLNELDGRAFDHYLDSAGTVLDGDAIGIWDPVGADQAWLHSLNMRLGFGVSGVSGAKLYRGRETCDPTLAWSGFACLTDRLGDGAPKLRYTLSFHGAAL